MSRPTASIVGLDLVAEQPEVALATAAGQVGGRTGHLIIALSALFSTASAVDATLFTSAQFSDRLIENGLLPKQLDPKPPDEFEEGEDIPERIVLIAGVLTAAFTVVGSLEGITSFASLPFIVVFGGMSFLALRERDHEDVSAFPPAIGLIGRRPAADAVKRVQHAAERPLPDRRTDCRSGRGRTDRLRDGRLRPRGRRGPDGRRLTRRPERRSAAAVDADGSTHR